jgi:hypothetical protein
MTLFFTHMFYLLTLLILAILAFIIYRKTANDYRPMLFYVVTLFVFETLEFILGYSGTILKYVISLQFLLEALLIVWQAKVLGIFNKRKNLYFWLMYGLLGFAIPVGFSSDGPGISVSFFRVLSCLAIILIAIEMLNRQLFSRKPNLLKNPVFLFSFAFIFYYLYNCLLEIFTIIGVDTGKDTLVALYYVGIMFAVITNFIYLRSLLCIPKTK